MPDLSDTVAKCRMGTAKKFYTSIASLSHISKLNGNLGICLGITNRDFKQVYIFCRHRIPPFTTETVYSSIFLISKDTVPSGLLMNSISSAFEYTCVGILISTPLEVLIACF